MFWSTICEQQIFIVKLNIPKDYMEQLQDLQKQMIFGSFGKDVTCISHIAQIWDSSKGAEVLTVWIKRF